MPGGRWISPARVSWSRASNRDPGGGPFTRSIRLRPRSRWQRRYCARPRHSGRGSVLDAIRRHGLGREWAGVRCRIGDLRLFRHRFEPALPARHWMGSAQFTDPSEAHALVVENGERSRGDRDLLPSTESYELGFWFREVLFCRCSVLRGLLPLDGRWPELRSDTGSLWERYISPAHRTRIEVVSRGRSRSASPLDADAASHGLFILDGEQRRPIDPATWETM